MNSWHKPPYTFAKLDWIPKVFCCLLKFLINNIWKYWWHIN